MKKWDVAIIGSGISSLTAAALLSKKGKSVCILEQHTKPGGYLHNFTRFGIPFETGSHYVGAMEQGQTFHTLLSYLGVLDDSLFTPLDAEGFDVFQFPHFVFEFPRGYFALIQRLCASFPSEKTAIRSYFQKVQDTVTQFPTYSFEPSFDEMTVVKALETPLNQVVESLTSHSGLKAILYGHSAISGVHPEDMPFGLHALIIDSMIIGPHGFKSGGDALTKRFVKCIEQNGGKLFLRTKVTQLLTDEKKQVTRALLSNGESVEAEWFLSGVHPKTTFSWFAQEGLKPAFKSRVAKLKESVGLFGVYGYSRTPPPLHCLKNYYLFHSENSKEYLSVGTPLEIPPAVFLTRTHRQEEVVEKYPLTFHSASPIDWFREFDATHFNKRPKHYFELKNQVARKVFESVDRFYPGLGQTIERFETSTPLTNLHFNGSPEGSAYGVYHSIENTGVRALGPRTHFKNLVLTGQSTLCPGILGAAISGLRSAGHLVGIKPILEELKTYRGSV